MDAAILCALRAHKIEAVLLCGYLKKVGPAVIAAYSGRIMNTHPSLLPRHGGHSMYGARVHEAVLASGDAESGISVHGVTAEYDAGPVIHQVRVPVVAGDTVASLTERVQAAEQRALVQVLNAVVRQELAA